MTRYVIVSLVRNRSFYFCTENFTLCGTIVVRLINHHLLNKLGATPTPSSIISYDISRKYRLHDRQLQILTIL
jgi:hypothetical protein